MIPSKFHSATGSPTRNIRKAVQLALAATALASLSIPAALAADTVDELAEVVVTGSAIKRVDAETAVPLTVLSVEELRSGGLTSVEQILGSLGANQTSLGTSQTVGSGNGGASFANLRGIGPEKTLVLLNGRRIANNSFYSSAPDLNSIPMAAIERIEVLRDGASSLYGTDAIGGVINFITKTDYQGISATVGYDHPEHPGGATRSANIGGGYGSLEKNGFNIFGFIDYQKQDNINGTQRPYNTRFVGGTSPTPSPANYYQIGAPSPAVMYNPLAPNCEGGTFTVPNDATSCSISTSNFVDYIPKSERLSAFVKGDLKLNDRNTLSAEYSVTRSAVKTLIAPVPYGLTAQNPRRPDGTPNPYYPSNNPNLDPNYDGTDAFGGFDWAEEAGCTFGVDCTLAGLGVSGATTPLQPGFVWVRWRDVPNGPRGDDNISMQHRALISLQGSAGSWDYNAGVSYNRTKTDNKLISGYGNGDMITDGIIQGIINPFGDQSAEGTTYLDNALLQGLLQYGRGTMTTLDARISNNALGDWLNAGRQAAFAFGMEYRKEDFLNAANTSYAELVVASTGIDPDTYNAGKRNIYAAYAEMNIPLHQTLDLTLAGRFDRYSDFGSTTNPKVSVRWQPIRQLVVRSAASTGFHAPSLYDLYGAQAYTNTGTMADPAFCPGGPGTGPNSDCKTQFVRLIGGNENLKPEKSKSFTLGTVIEPFINTSFSVDYWFIQIKDLIDSVPDETLLDLANQDWSAQYVHRVNGRLSTVTQICPGAGCGYIDARTQNPGSTLTDGVDLNGNWRIRTDVGRFDVTYNGTWVRRYNYQDYPNGPWNENVGTYVGNGPVFRWKQALSGTWKGEAFSAGATLHHMSGYTDDPNGEFPDLQVDNFITLDVFSGWDIGKGVSVTAGIRNLTDKAPPLTGQGKVFQQGYDPRFYDPTGRVFYARLSYNLSFK